MRFGRFVFKRILNGLIAYLIILLTLSIILNSFLDFSVRMQLSYMVNRSMSSWLDSGGGKGKSTEEIAEMRVQIQKSIEKRYDLDKPLVLKTLSRTWKSATWQFGTSYNTRASKQKNYSTEVRDIILEALPNTILIFVPATIISLIIALVLGIKKAQLLNSPFDRLTSILTMIFSGTPPWWMASLLVLLFAVKWPILPFGTLYSTPPPDTAIGLFFDRVNHMLLPLLSIILVRSWGSAYIIKSLLLQPLQEDYIQAARGRGIPERKVIFGHALRTASPAISTMTLLIFVSSFSGDILLERILLWPGLGTLLWNATNAFNPDVPLLVGISTVLTFLYCVSIILLDILYVCLDPRIKY